MAEIHVHLRVEFTPFSASLQSACTALANVHSEHELGLESIEEGPSGLAFRGVRVVNLVRLPDAGDVVLFTFRPAPGLTLFATEVLDQLPSYATVEWRGGWPFFNCPPRDDGDSWSPHCPVQPEVLSPA